MNWTKPSRFYGPLDARQQSRQTLVYSADDIKRNITIAAEAGASCDLLMAADIYVAEPIIIPETVFGFALDGGGKFNIIPKNALTMVFDSRMNATTGTIASPKALAIRNTVFKNNYNTTVVDSFIGTSAASTTYLKVIISNVVFGYINHLFQQSNANLAIHYSWMSQLNFTNASSGRTELFGDTLVTTSDFDRVDTVVLNISSTGAHSNIFKNCYLIDVVSDDANVVFDSTNGNIYLGCINHPSGYKLYNSKDRCISKDFNQFYPNVSISANVGSDKILSFKDSASTFWSVGHDSSASSFTISSGTTLGTVNDRLVITTSGTTVSDNLSVNGNTTLGNASGDTLTITGASVSVPNNLNFDSNTLFIDAANNRIGINDSTPSVALDVTGDGAFTGSLSAGAISAASLTLTGNLQVDGNTTLGNASGDTLTVNASTLSLGGTLTIDGGTLIVNPTTNTVTADILSVTGNATIGDASGDSFTVNAGTWSIANAVSASLGGTLNLDSGTLIVNPTTNTVTAAALAVTGAATVGTTLGVTGATTLSSTLSVEGNTTLGNANTDTLTINGTSVSVPNNLNFDSNTLFIDAANNRVGIGNAAPTVALDVTGSVLISTNLTVNGNTTIGNAGTDTLTVTATASLTEVGITGDLSCDNNVTVGADLTSAGIIATGSFNSNGSTTIGNASGDSFTVNSNAVSVPNGLNFDANTLVIDATNNEIGIGTTAPDTKLHVMVSDATASSNANAIATLEKNGTGYLQLLVPDANETGILFGLASNAAHGGIVYNSIANGLQFRANGNSTKMIIDSNGYVAIGSASATNRLDVNGSICVEPLTVNLTADNQAVTVGDESYIRLNSNDATSTNRTFILTQGLAAGQMLILECMAGACELVDGSAGSGGGVHRLSATWTANINDTLTLIFNGTDWLETARSFN